MSDNRGPSDLVVDEKSRQLFPLPLSSIERFHLFDYSPQFINILYGRFRFAGIIEPAVASRALELTLIRHPIWACRIVRSANRLQWEPAPERWQNIDWHQSSDGTTLLPKFDLYEEPAGRPQSRISDNKTQLGFYSQHTVCDGAGGAQFVADWMKYYHNLSTGNDIHAGFRKLHAADLVRRNRLDLLSRDYLKQIWKQPLGLYGATKFILRKPVEMCPEVRVAEAWDYNVQPQIVGRWFDESMTERLKDRANRESVMLNSLLVGELFKTLEAHRRRDTKHPGKWLRVILPMSLRTFADRRLPSANRATVVQVDRRAADFNRSDFYQSLDNEIALIRNAQLGKLFLLAIRGMSIVPGGLQRAARSDKCRGTVVFTNLSEPFGRLGLPKIDGNVQVGNMILKDYDMVGPIRHRMPINFNFVKHLTRFRLSLHSDPRVLSGTESAAILDDFYNRILGLTIG